MNEPAHPAPHPSDARHPAITPHAAHQRPNKWLRQAGAPSPAIRGVGGHQRDLHHHAVRARTGPLLLGLGGVIGFPVMVAGMVLGCHDQAAGRPCASNLFAGLRVRSGNLAW